MTNKKSNIVKLGVNIDHIATLRNARGEGDPSLLELAFEAQAGGAHSLTMHLREDRRHIKDEDLFEMKKHCKIPINMEMALTDEMMAVALHLKPKSVCIVPEKREELTTEGGLNLDPLTERLSEAIPVLKEAGIEVFLFTEPSEESARTAAKLGANGVEAHTGNYARAFFRTHEETLQMEKLFSCAKQCDSLGIEFHAGHGLNYHNMYNLLQIENLTEVNIGHAIVAQSLKTGLKAAVRQMLDIINRGRE